MFKFKELDYTPRFGDSYQALQSQAQKQCDKALGFLLDNPGHPGLNLKPIHPAKVYWEVRINQGDRLIIRPAGPVAHVIDVVTHDQISKWGHGVP